MTSGFDQARADIAHGAVVGGERLVQLRHVPADGRLLFDEIDLEALLGEIERSLHPRDATTDDHDCADRLIVDRCVTCLSHNSSLTVISDK